MSIADNIRSYTRLPRELIIPLAGLSLALASATWYFNACLASLTRQLDETKSRCDSLHGTITALETTLIHTQVGIDRLSKRRMPLQAASESIVCMGVQWREESGKTKAAWNGTAFGVNSSDSLLTAAHIAQWAQKQQVSLKEKGLEAAIVARFSDGSIVPVRQIKVHPRYSPRSENEPSIDLAICSIEPRPTRFQLRIALDTPQVSEEVFIAGFPNEVAQIRYPLSPEHPFVPTIRCGRVERIVDVEDLAVSLKHELLQLSIPVVGGFSGSPVLNVDGEVVGVAIFATHRLLNAREQHATIPSLGTTTRILDPAHVSFAVNANLLKEMLN